MAERQQLLEHDRDLLAVRRRQRIELEADGGRPAAPSHASAPAIGRLMFANRPPFGLFQVQTFGGVYSDELVIHAAPDFFARPEPVRACSLRKRVHMVEAIGRRPRRGPEVIRRLAERTSHIRVIVHRAQRRAQRRVNPPWIGARRAHNDVGKGNTKALAYLSRRDT